MLRDKLVYYDTELSALQRAIELSAEAGLTLQALKRGERRIRQARDYLNKLHKTFESAPLPLPGDTTVMPWALRSGRPLHHPYARSRFTPLPAGEGDYYSIDRLKTGPLGKRGLYRCLGKAGPLSVEALTALTEAAMTVMKDRIFDELAFSVGREQEFWLVGTLLSPRRELRHFQLARWPA
jgi:hypothetical protein